MAVRYSTQTIVSKDVPGREHAVVAGSYYDDEPAVWCRILSPGRNRDYRAVIVEPGDRQGKIVFIAAPAGRDRLKKLVGHLALVDLEREKDRVCFVSQQLVEYISACFTGLWVRSHEHEDALTEIAQMCRDQEWRMVVWDINRGLTIHRQGDDANVDTGTNDPLAAIRSLDALGSTDGASLLVLVNFHRFLQSP